MPMMALAAKEAANMWAKDGAAVASARSSRSSPLCASRSLGGNDGKGWMAGD